MTNISSTTVTFYNFIEMTHEIDRILGYEQRHCGKHFHPETGEFRDWCDTKGYGDHDSEGKFWNSSQIWFAEYQKDIADDKWDDTPYMDFWHWQLKNCVDESFRNDSYSKFSISMDYCCDDETQPWQREIMQVWHDTFKHLADEDGSINIWVSW